MEAGAHEPEPRGLKTVSERSETLVAGVPVILIDSITQVVAADAGRIVVSGSHAGSSAASFAAVVPARLYAFNDAGIGKEDAGIAGLELLENHGIAAVAVSHDSARIGDAADTLASGVITCVNREALALGFYVGEPLVNTIGRLVGES